MTRARQTIDVEKAFVVMGTMDRGGVTRLRQLSRRYAVFDAASMCAALWRREGVADAFVKTVIGREHKLP